MERIKIHLDTDIGGDIDDLCALALLLKWPGVHITGVTTVAEHSGKRAGYARYALALAGRSDVPVAAGADVSLGCFRSEARLPPEVRYWPERVLPSPGPLEAALELLKQSIEKHAIIVAIGPWTNLSLLERRYPEILHQATLFLMGGHVNPTPPTFPSWGHEMDYNVQSDIVAAKHVLESAHATLIPIEVTAQTALRRVHLPALRHAGPLGDLIVRQAEAFAEDERSEERYARTSAGLPRDFINFQHDPLACAVALGWRGVSVETISLALTIEQDWLHQRIDPAGRPTRVVTTVDGDGFQRLWLDTVTGSLAVASDQPDA